MRHLSKLILLAATVFLSLPSPAQPLAVSPPNAAAILGAFIRDQYTKFEYRLPARDGVLLFVSVYVPKDVFTDSRTYPVMMTRTPYSVAPYGVDLYRANLGPSELFAKEKFIFVYADVRGRYMSAGVPTQLKPHVPQQPGSKAKHRHLRHHRVAHPSRPRMRAQSRHVGYLAARILCQRRHD